MKKRHFEKLVLCFLMIAIAASIFTACNLSDLIPGNTGDIGNNNGDEGDNTGGNTDNAGDSGNNNGLDNSICVHNEVIDAAIAPTCTESGLTEGSHCSKCGEIFVKQEVIPTLGHSFNYEDAGENHKIFCHCGETIFEDHECSEWFSFTVIEINNEYYTRCCVICGRVEYKISGKDFVYTAEEFNKHLNETVPGDASNIHIHKNIVSVEGTEPTCTNPGSEYSIKCTDCEQIIYTKVIPALGHNMKETESGHACVDKKVCEKCGHESIEYTHNYETTGHKDFTCTDNGYDEYTCTKCEDVKNIILEARHILSVNTLEPNCTDNGSRTTTCENCDYSDTQILDALGHNRTVVYNDTTHTEKCSRCNNVYSEETHTKEVDCQTTRTEEGGYAVYTSVFFYKCVGFDGKCGYKQEITRYSVKIPLSGDDGTLDFEYIHEITEPNCTEDGLFVLKRSDTNEEISRTVIPALGHKNGDWIIDTEPTCIPGLKYIECEICKEVINTEEIKPVLNHDSVFYEGKDATCTNDGWKAYETCARDGCNYTTYEIVTAFGHSEVADPAYDATCTEDGLTEGSHCSVCGEVFVKQNVIPATGHSWGESNCLNCGILKTAENLKYTLSSDETYYSVSGIGTCKDSYIVIPSEYEGLPVKAIDAYAFQYCTSITGVFIPASIESIGVCAFERCTSLESLTVDEKNTKYCIFGNCLIEIESQTLIQGFNNSLIPTGGIVLKIADYAFSGCTGLTDIDIPEGVISIGSSAFIDCSGAIVISIPKSLTSLGESAFAGCTSVTEMYFNVPNLNGMSSYNHPFADIGKNGDGVIVTIGNEVTKIPQCMFYDLKKITRLLFEEESKCESIDISAFYGCIGLTDAQIPSSVKEIGNNAFRGCTSLTNLIAYSGLTSIGNYAFLGCKALPSVNLPEGLISIGAYAFQGCSGMISLTIPSSVTSISNYAFKECYGLTEIYFNAINLKDFANKNYVFADAGTKGEGITVTVGKEVTKIPAYMFSPYDRSYIPNIVSVVFEDQSECTIIGNYAFYYSSSLKNIVIAESVESIGYYAFYGCSGLTAVNLPANLTYMGGYVFTSCTGLTNLTIAEGAKVIGSYAFGGCSLLNDVKIPASVTQIDGYAFYQCTSLTSITIPENVKSIGSYAFSGCTKLNEIYYNAVSIYDLSSSSNIFSGSGQSDIGINVTIGKDVTNITKYLFYGASCISRVVFEEGSKCESIGTYAFCNCDALAYVEIPSNIKKIEDYAFYGCNSLSEIYYKAINLSYSISYNNSIFAYAGVDGEGITLTVNKDVTHLPDYMFHSENTYSSPKITSIVFEEGSKCEKIGYGVLDGCVSLVNLNLPEGLLSIYSSAFSGCIGLTSIKLPQTLMSIGNSAFYGCTAITSIEIPKNVTYIGNSAFYGCENLTEIYYNAADASDLSARNEVFYNAGQSTDGIKVTIGNEVINIPSYLFSPYNYSYMPKITDVTFENGSKCQKIGNNAFYNCVDITHITLPEGLVTIGDSAFADCTALTDISIPGSVTDIGSSAFSGCSALTDIVIPEGVTSVKYYTFGGCSSLTDATIPASVTEIGSYAFNSCSSLTTIEIPENVTLIGEYAFSSCYRLMNVTIPEKVTFISSYTFAYCSNLTSITIHNGITAIASQAFADCYKLIEVVNKSSINIVLGSYENGHVAYYAKHLINDESESNIIKQGDYVFYKDTDKYYLISYTGTDTDIVLPDNINGNSYEIYNYAFYRFDNLTSVTILEGVTSIGNCVFTLCSNLMSVSISESVSSIGISAFSSCTALSDVILPESLTSIGESAFGYCTSLLSITVPEYVTSIGYGAFSGCSSLTSVTFENVNGWYVTKTYEATEGTDVNLEDAYQNGTYLTSTYSKYYWYKK